MTSPSLQIVPEMWTNAIPVKTIPPKHMKIFRRGGNRFRFRARPRRLRYAQTGNAPNGGWAVFPPKGYSIRLPPASKDLGRAGSNAGFLIVTDPLNFPSSSAHSAGSIVLSFPLATFFSPVTELTKLQRN